MFQTILVHKTDKKCTGYLKIIEEFLICYGFGTKNCREINIKLKKKSQNTITVAQISICKIDYF